MTTKAKTLEHDGKQLTIAKWSKETGLPEATIRDRIKLGWTTERALTTPSDSINNRPVSIGRAMHTGILASLKTVWEQSGRAEFEKQLADSFEKDALKTVLAFQNLLPKSDPADTAATTTPTCALQINNVIKPSDFHHYKPLGS
jgi:hypothetical protein